MGLTEVDIRTAYQEQSRRPAEKVLQRRQIRRVAILSRQDGRMGDAARTLEAGKESSFAYFLAAIWEGIAAFLFTISHANGLLVP